MLEVRFHFFDALRGEESISILPNVGRNAMVNALQ